MTETIKQLNKEKILFWGLVTLLFLSAGVYMYCIQATVRNVVSRQDIETKSSQLMLSIGKEEFQYITMRNNITIGMAYSMGFKDAPERTFISKKSLGFVSFASKMQ